MADELAGILNRMQQKTNAQPMVLKRGSMFELTVEELGRVCARNPTHPIAQDFLGVVARFPKTLSILVEKLQLQAVIENRQIRLKTFQETMDQNGMTALVNVEEKELV